jgi:hypothetical protein
MRHEPRRVVAKENRTRESAAAIPAKNRVWRAAMSRQAVVHENFFIAKKRDSESATTAYCRP